jgi:hypothetical protein
MLDSPRLSSNLKSENTPNHGLISILFMMQLITQKLSKESLMLQPNQCIIVLKTILISQPTLKLCVTPE